MLITSIVKSFFRSVEAEDRLVNIQQKIEGLGKQNQVLSGSSKEYSSTEFIEKQIRNKLKLVKPGEKVVILPVELMEKEEGQQYSYKEVEQEVGVAVVAWREWAGVFW
jgi:hypothetical protein